MVRLDFFIIFAVMRKVIKTLFVIGNVMVAMMFVLSTLAGFLPPSSFEWASLLSYGFFVLLLANVAFALLWACCRSWWFALSTACIVLRFTFVPLFFQLGGNETFEADPEQTYLTVMDWNVHMFEGPDDDRNAIDDNAHLFLKTVRDEDPDVLVMQEFYVPNKVALHDSLKSMGFTHFYGSVRHGGVPTGVALYSRYPLSNPTDIDANRKFYADVKVGNAKVRVVCVHMDSYMLTPENREELRRAQEGETVKENLRPTLRKLRETYKAHEHEWNDELLMVVTQCETPLLLCGDFNDTPASYLYQQCRKHLDDSYVEQGNGTCSTYHGPFPNYRIDYILHSRDMEAMTYKLVENEVSDHHAVKTTLRLNLNETR